MAWLETPSYKYRAMKILLATFSLLTLVFLAPPMARAQFVPGPNPIAGTVTAAETLPSGTGVVTSTGNLQVSGGSVAVTVTGTSSIQNDGMIKQTGTGRAIRDNTGGLTLTVTNNAGALIQAADADVIQMNRPNSNISFDNHGSLISLNASAGGSQAIDWNAITTGNNTLHNFPTGFIEAFEADAVRPGVNGSVINEGMIKSVTSTGSSSDGVDGQSNNGLVINNNGNGLIEGGRHGITAEAANASVMFTLSVTNQLNAIIQGDNGSGMNIDGFNANEVVTIHNDGTITGNGMTGDGDGVDVDGLVNLTNTGVIRSLNAFSAVPGGEASEGITVGGGTIDNSGAIEGLVSPGNVNAVGRGITLAGVDAGGTPEPIYADTTVTNSGLIRGQTDSGIVVLGAASGFTVTINNQPGGTIEGGGATAAAIQTGADDDTVNNAGEVIADASGKAIDLGAGDDTLNFTGGAIHGDISGGTGANTFTIDPGPRHFNYRDNISNFDSVEIKGGVVTFFGANTYTGTTTVSGGTLIAANSTGSATGSGPVQVISGTLGGDGTIDGAVTIGGGSGPATLAPGDHPKLPKFVVVGDSLAFQTNGIYLYNFNANRNNVRADKVIANGVAITGGANVIVNGDIGGRLPVGTILTLISNTAPTPIAGTFANLPDGSVITIKGNNFRASYEGGDGNDLTLTVVP
jgi:autotransporter-associated beta strand protein